MSAFTIDNTGAAQNAFYVPFATSPNTIISINTPYYQPQTEVRRTTKTVSIQASLKGFSVSYTDSHGGIKTSEYSEEELTKALPELLAKLRKEPKEE